MPRSRASRRALETTAGPAWSALDSTVALLREQSSASELKRRAARNQALLHDAALSRALAAETGDALLLKAKLSSHLASHVAGAH